MKYMMITIDMMRLAASLPLYLAAMLFSGIGKAFEYAANKVDIF